MQLSDKCVVVTGGTGFFGSYIARAFKKSGAGEVYGFGRRDYDLRERDAVQSMLSELRPHIVVHAAGLVGGIGANRHRPGEFFFDNAQMGLNVVDQCWRVGLEKLVVLGTICSYPKFAPVPMRESDLWDGYPEETNAPYGLAKKMLLVQQQSYRQQYGWRSIHLMPVNLYGPGDSFEPASSHVIPALIAKCLYACEHGLDCIEVWGTGMATREFLYVEDAAEAVVLATQHYDGAEPVNLSGSGEIAIAELVTLIAELTGFSGGVKWRADMPDGQPRRSLDASMASKAFGWSPRTSLREGLRACIEEYQSQRPLSR